MLEALVLSLIIVMRTTVPIFVFRWPFWAALACVAADASDSILQDAFGVKVISHYHNFDKGFDIYYLSIEALVAYRMWTDPLARAAALVLWGLRASCVVAFEITDIRQLFLFPGPNIFENFYLWIAGSLQINPEYRLRSKKHLAFVLLITGAPKVLQEYVMHYREAQTWHFVKRNVLLWR
jgi:hypothetical protein